MSGLEYGSGGMRKLQVSIPVRMDCGSLKVFKVAVQRIANATDLRSWA